MTTAYFNLRFYAPWCGHCKNLKPAYEKAAKSLAGLAKVAAVNCDEEENKPFCGSMGVQGFPTLKIVRPGKKPGRPNVEDYQGPRNAKGIVEAVKDKITNHVKRVTDKSFEDWMAEGKSTHKAILFSDKGTTSATIKAVAIDFLGSLNVAQIRDKEKASVERFGITKFPTLILLPVGEEEHSTYDGDMTKEGINKFLSKVASPNPDPAPKAVKAAKSSKSSKDSKKASKDKVSFSSASKSHASADASSSRATQTSETIVDDSIPTDTTNPNLDALDDETEKPIKVPSVAPTIPSLSTPEELQQACLTSKSGTCILLLLSSSADPAAAFVTTLSEVHARLSRHGKIFPFYSVPSTNSESGKLRSSLSLASDAETQILAINAKKSWVKKYSGTLDREGLESWIDGIRMGEGAKGALPAELIVAAAEKSAEPMKEEEPKVTIESIEELTDEDLERLLARGKDTKGQFPVHEEL